MYTSTRVQKNQHSLDNFFLRNVIRDLDTLHCKNQQQKFNIYFGIRKVFHIISSILIALGRSASLFVLLT